MIHTPKVRVANFSDIDLPIAHCLEFRDLSTDDIDKAVETIRRYADLPFVYVVAGEGAGPVSEVMAALKAIRSPCYPYAVFAVNGAKPTIDVPELDVVDLGDPDPETIRKTVDEYAVNRFRFDNNRLRVGDAKPLPDATDVAIVGGGITGLYVAGRLKDAGISAVVLEKRDMFGGIWSSYANFTSQVNSSECAYRLFEKPVRSNRDHTGTLEILEDIAGVVEKRSDRLFPETEVTAIEKAEDHYRIRFSRRGEASVLRSRGVILAVNDRVGTPRKIEWPNQAAFQGEIRSGISDGARDIDWRDKNVVIVGMGAFAVENARTAFEGGAKHVTVLCRRHGTVCPKIIDYLNFATPYDDEFQHDKKSNMKNMMLWKKLYDLSGATKPECWMGKIKHDGHTISVSDIWFIAHYLKKIETVVGGISEMTETGVVLDNGRRIDADVVLNCIGFERNASAAKALSGFSEIYNTNYLDKDFMYLADAFIDGNAFNSMFGSSVLEMVKFYLEVFITFFDNPEYETMMKTEGIEKIDIEERNWSQYIKGAMSLIRSYPEIREIAHRQVGQRTRNFLEIHDLKTYIAANKREWIDTHSLLAGRPMKEAECLPYLFEKLL